MGSIGPDGTQASAAKLEVVERVRSFAALRGAQRALEPSACAPGQLPAPDRWREIRERLAALSKGLARGDADTGHSLRAELAGIDERLATLKDELVAALDAVPLSQLRATLPTTFLEYEDEVVALLDLCVDTERGRAERVRITEYLVTLIASEQCAGVRRMVRDPVHISGALNRYAGLMAAALGAETRSASAAEAFDDAARRLQEASNVSPVLDEVRALKQELGEAIFAPGILRAVVDYNLSVWNRHEDLLDRTRTDDWIADSELILSIELEGEDELESGVPEHAVDRPSESELERAESQRDGIEGIEAAIARRLRGQALERELHARIIAGLELSEREQKAFEDPNSAGADEVFRAMVATGAALRSLPEASAALQELGLRPGVLQADWVRALNERIRQTTKQLIANGSYGEAREISATKHRFLYASLAELIRNATRKAGASETYVEGAGEAIRRAAADGGSWRPSIVFLDTKAKRISAAAVLFLILIGTVGLRLQLVKARPIDHYSQERLADVSDLIDSGYRKLGFGRLFVGTVGPEWKDLSVEEQREEGIEIARRLHYQGVREVMLYDGSRQLRFHYAGGTVRTPAATRRP